MGTIIVGVLCVIIIGISIYTIVKQNKKGGCASCSQNCSKCNKK